MSLKTPFVASGITVAVLALSGLTGSASAQGPALPPCVQHPLACITPTIAFTPCTADPSVPTCVNEAFDDAESTIVAAQSIYNNKIQPTLDGGACLVYQAVTGKTCPRLVPQLG